MGFILQVWNWLNGKKSVIGSICLWIGTIGLPFIIGEGYNPAWIDTLARVLTWLGGIMTPLGVGHKAIKKRK